MKAPEEIVLTAPDPFSFEETIRYLSRTSAECLFRIEDNRVYKLVAHAGQEALVEISAMEHGRLLVRFVNPASDPGGTMREAVRQYVAEWFDFGADLLPFYEMAGQDPLLRQVTVRFHGLRNIGIPDLFEALCWGILGQQIHLAFAYQLKRRFVEGFGRNVEWNGRSYWAFPTPERIAGLSPEDLTPMKISSKKAEYLIGTARLVAEGKLTKEGLLETGDLKLAEKQLVQIRGIGPWTANYALMRCLRFPSAFPIDDVGLHNAIKHLLGWDRKPTVAEIRKMAAGWTNWESYATFYLWRSLY
jgi:DNA-3-methyladenine glycosylase II